MYWLEANWLPIAIGGLILFNLDRIIRLLGQILEELRNR